MGDAVFASRSGAVRRCCAAIKDVKYQTMTSQFRNYFATGMPVNIVVNPDTVVSGPLQAAIFRSGGEILVRGAPGVFDGYQG